MPKRESAAEKARDQLLLDAIPKGLPLAEAKEAVEAMEAIEAIEAMEAMEAMPSFTRPLVHSSTGPVGYLARC